MKPLIELITAWEHYTTKATSPTVADFCAQYLQKNPAKKVADDTTSQDADSVLASLIGKISGLHTTYARMAIKEIPDIELEWFYLLNVINFKREAKKTDAISLSMMEQSTGIDILNRMKKRGLITEKSDPADKRARLVSLTDKGKALLTQIGYYLYKVAYLLYHDIKGEDKQRIITILTDTAHKQEQIRIGIKSRSIDEMIESLYGEKALDKILSAFKQQVKQQEKIMHATADKDIDKMIRSFHK